MLRPRPSPAASSAPPRALVLALALALAPAAARPSSPGEPITAVRLRGEVIVDGLAGEDAWREAPAFDGFVQLFPTEGAAPSEATEVRVVYDDRHLYVSVVAHDREPARLKRQLGRRDAAPYSDSIVVFVDPRHDGRLAYFFELNAAGVQSDGLLYADDQLTRDWDAAWSGAVQATGAGWSAELAIPLAALRFSDAPAQTWGFGVKRIHARTHEELATALIPRTARGQAARLGPLVGVADLAPRADLSVSPYLAARVSVRPQYSDDTRPTPRLADPVGEVGLDVRASLGRELALAGTLNPDFGQVEADEIIQNLSSFEIFFPEKRPFFTEGMDLFQPVQIPGRKSPQRLFYSRRIGLDAPILAAAKLSGAVAEGVEVGVVEAVVTGASTSAPEDAPDRRFRFRAEQPLRLGPMSALPALAPAPRNFLVGVTRLNPAPGRTFGATVASALPLGARCTAEEDLLPDPDDAGPGERVRPARCAAAGGGAAALDWNLRTADGEWFLLGQATASRAEGGPPVRTLPDGTRLARGEAGLGAHAALGRHGGEPWRFELHWEYQSPTLELNALGFQRTQNEQLGRALVRYVRPNGGGPFLEWLLVTGVEGRRTTDGRGLARGAEAWLSGEVQLRSFHVVGCTAALDADSWDVREVDEAGVAFRRPGFGVGECWARSDPSRPLSVELGAFGGRTGRAGPLPSATFAGAEAELVLRPHPRLETRLAAALERASWPARYVGDDSAGDRIFGALTSPSASLTLRQQVVLGPRLTLQAYAQLFTAYGRYGRLYAATAPRGARIPFSALRAPATSPRLDPAIGEPDFREGALNVNLVARWEYRAGSTLFLVYTRAQAERGWDADGAPPATLRPHALSAGPATDTVLVKWTHFWNG